MMRTCHKWPCTILVCEGHWALKQLDLDDIEWSVKQVMASITFRQKKTNQLVLALSVISDTIRTEIPPVGTIGAQITIQGRSNHLWHNITILKHHHIMTLQGESLFWSTFFFELRQEGEAMIVAKEQPVREAVIYVLAELGGTPPPLTENQGEKKKVFFLSGKGGYPPPPLTDEFR